RGCATPRQNYFIHNNHFGSPAKHEQPKGTPPNHHHHNGIFLFNNSSGYITQGWDNIYIYDNRFDGDPGCCSTDRIFLQRAQFGHVYVFNNVFDDRGQPHGETNSLLGFATSTGSNSFIYNNTELHNGSPTTT